MDHLPSISSPALSIPRVPCLCEVQNLSDGNFTDFPFRHGWDFNELSWPVRIDKSKTSREQIAEFLQAWLFFGLLRDVFGAVEVEIRLNEFVTEADMNDGTGVTKFLTTVSLPNLLREWADREKNLDQSLRRRHQEAVIATLKQAEDVVNGNLFRTDTPEALRPLDDTQRLAICILYETLRYACASIGPDTDASSHLPRPALCALPRTNMKSLGWCPSDVALIHEVYDNTTLFFASMIHRDHHGLDHSKCSAKECTARQVDNNTYKPQHRDKGCDCLEVAVDVNEIGRIIRTGQIPRILIEQDGTECQLKVTAATPYVAISHVWSDGLGNVGKNALPLCQLKNLKDITAVSAAQRGNTGPSELAIWIDTLCVPVEPEGRKLAMLQFPDVYARAEKVVVLDGELQKASLDANVEEKAVRLCISGWMRRIWTLEEGVIGRDRLFIKFCEGLLPLPERISSLYDTIGLNSVQFLGQYLPPRPTFKFVADMQGPPVPADNEKTKTAIANLLVAVQYRTTSRLEDESICFGYLLKMDVAPLFEETTADLRMKKFLTNLSRGVRSLPAHFVFTQEPKLQADGFRWAPKSFTSIRPGDLPRLLQSLRRTPARFDASGLRYKHLAFLLQMRPEAKLNKTIYFHDAKQKLCRMVELHPDQEDILADFDTNSQLALLVTNDVLGAAALVAVQQTEVGTEAQVTYYARWMCPAATMLIPGMRLEGNERIFSFGGGECHPPTYSVCTAKWISNGSWWHIG